MGLVNKYITIIPMSIKKSHISLLDSNTIGKIIFEKYFSKLKSKKAHNEVKHILIKIKNILSKLTFFI